MKKKIENQRREFLKRAAWAAVALPAVSVLGTRLAWGADCSKLKPATKDSPDMAKNLKYVPKSKTKHCDKCSFYSACDKKSGKGTCTLIKDFTVEAKGTCISWVEKK